MTRHLKPREYARLAAQDRALGSLFVAPPAKREFEGTRPFMEPERPKAETQKTKTQQGEPT